MLLIGVKEDDGWLISRWNLTYPTGWAGICNAVYVLFDCYENREILVNHQLVDITEKDNIKKIKEDGNMTIRGYSPILHTANLITFYNQLKIVEVHIAKTDDEFKSADYQQFNESLCQYMDSIELAMRPRPTDMLDIIEIIDNTTACIRVYKKKAAEDKKYDQVVQSFEKTEKHLRNILKRQGVESYRNPGHDVDLSKQEIVGSMPTDDRSKDGRIATRVADGYIKGERVLRLEKIRVYEYNNKSDNSINDYKLICRYGNCYYVQLHIGIMAEQLCELRITEEEAQQIKENPNIMGDIVEHYCHNSEWTFSRFLRETISDYMAYSGLSSRRISENLEKLQRHEDIMLEFYHFILSEKYPEKGIFVRDHAAEELASKYNLSPLGAYNYLIYLREKPEEALAYLAKGLPKRRVFTEKDVQNLSNK